MRILPILFSFALFCSALLSFSVQPILGKMMLPVVGGSPAGWIVAMSFFQLALLAGYGISWGLGRFSPWVHAGVLLLLYVAGWAFLPPSLPDIDFSGSGFALSTAVIEGLFRTIFVPFLALTATTAALQRVFSATRHATAHDPYYLFVASNAGSFIGLFAYPFILEPFFDLTAQAQTWHIVYAAVIVLLIAACGVAWHFKQEKQERAAQATTHQPVAIKQVLWWIVLAFIPCSLSMGVTNLITTDIGGLPLFWVIPLGLYLLTFILAFASKPLLSQDKLDFYHLVAGLFIVVTLAIGKGYQPNGGLLTFAMLGVLLLGVFFVIAWSCHQRLASMRPSVNHLAFYYFIVALGGGLAGIVHVFVVPFTLKYVVEFPIMVLLSLLIVPIGFAGKTAQLGTPKVQKMLLVALVLGAIAVIPATYFKAQDMRIISSLFSIILLCSTMVLVLKPRYLALLGLAAMIAGTFIHYPGTVLMNARNFYGVQAVYTADVEGRKVKYFVHGNTIHGLEIVEGAKPDETNSNSYYSQTGPIGDVLDITEAESWAVLGLGSGQLACFRETLITDFYEIDPDVEDVAREYFSYLNRCPPREVVIGDGRLELQKSPHKYDVIIMDAFTSDGIPIHLVTREAAGIYLEKINDGGAIIVHVSNRYLNLKGAVAAVFAQHELPTYFKLSKAKGKAGLHLESEWLAVPTNPAMETALQDKGWKKVKPAENAWTDEKSTLLTVIRWP